MVVSGALAGNDFRLGVDVFLGGHTQLVKGMRVGLITNQTGANSQGVSTIDLLHANPGVNLVALFSPEHGIRGKALAGELVNDERDAKTGLPVYSLYGPQGHRPTEAQMALVDVLVYDIQDVGSRAYTYIWTMAECLKAAAEAGKTFIILDRPNPLGGRVVDGPVTDPQWKSFLGLYPIPRVYGMTVGELARYLNREHGIDCRLVIVPLAGYTRDMGWKETGLTWIPSSPNIPTPEAAVGFAATGTIGTLGFIDIGIGTQIPFQVVGASWLDAEASARLLNSRGLPGVKFVPYALERNGRRVPCVYLHVTDPTRFFPTTTEMVILDHLQRSYPQHFRWPREKLNGFDKAMGTSTVRESLDAARSVNAIAGSWQTKLDGFRTRRVPYLIYP